MPADKSDMLPKLDKYEVLSEIGSGAMGCVYKARHTFMNRYVAVKVISPNLVDSDDARRRAIREARISANLSHPNIVQTHDVEQVMFGDSFTICTIYEFITGVTLNQYFAKDPKPTFSEALRIGREICAGMAHAHEKGVVHRDLKPDNIMLADGMTVKIADFGLARDLARDDTVTQEGVIVGTPRFMAPEQIKAVPAKDLTPAVDVYAIGVILYRLFTGKYPFTGKAPAEVLQKVLSQKPPRPQLHDPTLPPECDKIIMRALEKDSAKRYASAGHLLAKLETLQADGRLDTKEQGKTVFEKTSEKTLPPKARSTLPSSAKKTSLSHSAKAVKAAKEAPVVAKRAAASARKIIPAIFVILVLCLLGFHQFRPKDVQESKTARGTDPVPFAKELLAKFVTFEKLTPKEKQQHESPGYAPKEALCAKLGKLVRGSHQYRRLKIDDEQPSPSLLGLYFLSLLAESEKRYVLSLQFTFMIVLRGGTEPFRINGQTIIEDMMDRYLSWMKWDVLAETFKRFTDFEKKLTIDEVIVIAQKAMEAALQLRRDIALGRKSRKYDTVLVQANKSALFLVRLLKKFPVDRWPPERREEREELIAHLLLLNDSAEAQEMLDREIFEIETYGAHTGLNKAIILPYKAIPKVYSNPPIQAASDFDKERDKAIAIMKEALAAVEPQQKDLSARLQALLAVFYCRSSGSLGASTDKLAKVADAKLAKIDLRGLKEETRALITAKKSYTAACLGEAERAEKLLQSIELNQLSKNDRWWFYRARAEIILAGKGNNKKLQEAAAQALLIAPAPFIRYASSVNLGIASKK